jgi:hypothetical protein
MDTAKTAAATPDASADGGKTTAFGPPSRLGRIERADDARAVYENLHECPRGEIHITVRSLNHGPLHGSVRCQKEHVVLDRSEFVEAKGGQTAPGGYEGGLE